MTMNLKGLEDKTNDHEGRLQELEARTLSVFNSLKISKRKKQIFNPTKLFFAECLVSFIGARVTPPDLYAHYKKWCSKHGIQVLRKRDFSTVLYLEYPTIRKKRYGSRDHFFGIALFNPPH